MKKLIIVCAVLMSSAPAHAGIDLSWDACAGASGTGTPAGSKVLLCDGTGVYEIYGQVQPSVPITAFLAIDGQLEWQDLTGPFAGFWEWESGGVNEGTMRFIDARGVSGGCDPIPNPNCAAATTLWGITGSQGTEVFAFTRGNTGPNRAQLVFADARISPLTTTIAAGTNLYAFTIIIDERVAAGAGGLAGCTDAGAVALNQINITSVSQPTQIEVNPGLRDNCVVFNGGASACFTIPTRNKTWGSIKTLYR